MNAMSDIRPRQYGPGHYFPGMVKITVLYGILLGVVWSRILPIVPSVIIALLFSIGEAWFISWLASRRKPVTIFEQVVGAKSWKYADLSGQYDDVVRSVEDMLRSMCTARSVEAYGIPGVLAGETKPNFWTWCVELLVLVERMDPAVTRVQVLSRPLVPTNVFDFGANKRLAARFIDGMRCRYADLSAGT